jgi:hypothetical protein
MNVQGFDFTVDVLQSILWQYNQATTLLALLNNKQNWLDENQTKFWFNVDAATDETGNGWYQNVFNLITADTFGLAVWSIILGLPLYVTTPQVPNSQIWGFNEYTDDTDTALINNYFNFGSSSDTVSNFSNLNTTISLQPEEQRFLLRLRYYQLITRGQILSPQALESDSNLNPTPYDINAFLNYLCETSHINYSGTIYIIDNLDMTITYAFTSANFPSGLFEAIKTLDLFPRPAGVLLNTETILNGDFYFLNTNVFTLLNGNAFNLLKG